MGLLVGGIASQVLPLVLVPSSLRMNSVLLSFTCVASTVCMSGLGWLLASQFVRLYPQNDRAILHVEMVYTSCCLVGMSSTWIGNDILQNRMELFVPRMVGLVIALLASGAIWYCSLELRHSENASLEIDVDEPKNCAFHLVRTV
jgi:hypothetical protein